MSKKNTAQLLTYLNVTGLRVGDEEAYFVSRFFYVSESFVLDECLEINQEHGKSTENHGFFGVKNGCRYLMVNGSKTIYKYF